MSTSQRLTEFSELPAIPSAVASATETKLGALFSPCLSVTWPHDYLPYSNHSLDCRIAWKFQKMIRESQTRHFSLFGAIEAKMTILAFRVWNSDCVALLPLHKYASFFSGVCFFISTNYTVKWSVYTLSRFITLVEKFNITDRL